MGFAIPDMIYLPRYVTLLPCRSIAPLKIVVCRPPERNQVPDLTTFSPSRYLTGCPQSAIDAEPAEELPIVSPVVDTGTGEGTMHPDNNEIHLGIALIGRGTSVIHGRAEPLPEESRTGKGEIIKKREEDGEDIEFIGDHIPEMVCHPNLDFLCSSTRATHQLLGHPTDNSCRLRVVLSRRLRPIKEPKEEDMLTAHLQCFPCKYDGIS
jgi:hypothetical protein